ncbi:L,D-transpeptidase [Sinorhizobium chiapasense]|uniref:L,D-transpeptidase n=1 Tax=Sinorhizobium chiapasense TaxID=501572 RepID=A0ABZ2BDL5_9HYPH
MDKNNLRKRMMLHFDGDRLTATEGGRYSGSWPAVSGRPGHDFPTEQHNQGNGPIPEGRYSVGELQHRGIMDDVIGLLGYPFGKGGKWPGGRVAWGNSRAWLTPKADIDPKYAHRSGFSIHGGRDPGSAGCIDLTDQMDRFADFHDKTGQSAELVVSYPDTSTSERGNRWTPDSSLPRNRRFPEGISLWDALSRHF